jgi:hypothetical protein
LNTIGRKPNDDKSGNILLWTRKAEEYLIQSGHDFANFYSKVVYLNVVC